MNIAFCGGGLCERGTTISLFDYAYYNQTILNNKSFIFYYNTSVTNQSNVINKFKEHFIVHGVDHFDEIEAYIKIYNISHIYTIKYGLNDSQLSKIAKNCIHCVFNCTQPHGDVFTSISPCVYGNNGQYPVVPHMINLPNHPENMREELNIPKNAIIFGGYGGSTSFSIRFVHEVVYNIAKYNSHIYFLFANFYKFCPDLPNIIHLPMIVDLNEKVKFINTTDAMLWARQDGETFGIAIGEFSTKNKPVIAMKIGDLAHAELLGDKALWYNDPITLINILLSFNPEIEKTKDWNAYKDYTPEKVMNIFKNVYLS